uniref:Reverse transcriptase domain-containing protein n=1 Tax=Ananas comosus var. bracteatus TaxID=296719 RepID=A0A6V7NH44_ANACO|nr:unnamed protein product [Ananas comosus var. bracteatus]
MCTVSRGTTTVGVLGPLPPLPPWLTAARTSRAPPPRRTSSAPSLSPSPCTPSAQPGISGIAPPLPLVSLRRRRRRRSRSWKTTPLTSRLSSPRRLHRVAPRRVRPRPPPQIVPTTASNEASSASFATSTAERSPLRVSSSPLSSAPPPPAPELGAFLDCLCARILHIHYAVGNGMKSATAFWNIGLHSKPSLASTFIVVKNFVNVLNNEMLLGACMRSRNRATHFFPRVSSISNSFAVYFGNCREVSRSYNAHFLLDEVEEAGEDVTRRQHTGRVPFSLAKSLACLQEEFTVDRQKPLSRMEQKRLIELRIKKKVKAQFLNGKFHDLMGTVVANPDSLRDAYDIICLNSNVDLASRRHDVCFNSLAEQLESGDFDIEGNTIVIISKGSRKECLVLPRLKLKVIQEAIRVVLEVVFRPHFSKISHGCRSGRGCRSALRFICEEIGRPDWCFTIPMNKEANGIILSKLILEFKEKIEDAHLISFIQSLFNARVLNMVFGGYPKGHGLPQEGVLSPILMNIYLDVLDRELFRISMRYEALRSDKNNVKNVDGSNLRRWFQRQIKDRDDTNEKQIKDGAGTRIFACRYMDEIFIAIFGSKDVAQDVKTEVIAYLNNSLFLDVEDKVDLMTVSKNSCSLQFAGTVVRVTEKESTALKAVHKLKDKVALFASQKQEIWDAMNLRIGKKWLAHGLRRIKESEIKQLGLSSPLLDHISQFRKEGMKTDHWFKSLLNIWMQDIKAKTEANEDVLLSKQIAEPALPQDLRDSFYNFQIKAKEYVSSESAATLALLNCSTTTENIITKMEAPIKYVKKAFIVMD